MKRNILMILVLFGLGYFAYTLVKEDKTPTVKSNDYYDFSYRDFAVKNIEKVKKIVVVNRNKGVFTFEKKGNIWMVNDIYKADQLLVNNMLSVINKVKIDYVPVNAAEENILSNMAINGIKVEIYDNKEQALKKYYIGGTARNSIGTYFVMDGYDKPLVMTIPGFKGNLNVRFSYSLNNWRDKTILSEDIDKIEEIELKYRIDEESSFVLKKIDDEFIVNTVYEGQKEINKPVDQKFSNSYLVGFNKKGAEGLIDDKELIANVISQLPIATLKVKRVNGSFKEMKIYMKPSVNLDELPDFKGIYKYLNNSVHRYFLSDENGDLFQIQYGVFKDIFIPYKSFFMVD